MSRAEIKGNTWLSEPAQATENKKLFDQKCSNLEFTPKKKYFLAPNISITLSCLIAKFWLKFLKQLFQNRDKTYKAVYLTTDFWFTKIFNLLANLSPWFYLCFFTLFLLSSHHYPSMMGPLYTMCITSLGLLTGMFLLQQCQLTCAGLSELA